MIDRIKQIMEFEKLSSSQFADEIGVQRSALSHVMSGRNNPSLDFIMKIKNCFSDIRLDWLLLGQGEMLQTIKGHYQTETLFRENELFDKDNNMQPTHDLQRVASAESETENENDYSIESSRETPSRNGRKLKKIVLLYSDGSFQEYNRD